MSNALLCMESSKQLSLVFPSRIYYSGVVTRNSGAHGNTLDGEGQGSSAESASFVMMVGGCRRNGGCGAGGGENGQRMMMTMMKPILGMMMVRKDRLA